MDNNVKMNIENELENTAFHECGHIVMTYFYGFTVQRVQLFESNPGTGFSQSHYGYYHLLITSITKFKNDRTIFDRLPVSVKINCEQLAKKMLNIIVAGPVAESLYLNGVEFQGGIKFELSGPDDEVVKNIEYFLSIFAQQPNSDFLNNSFKNVTDILRNKKLWNSITFLSKILLESTNKFLIQAEIEKALNDCGFYS